MTELETRLLALLDKPMRIEEIRRMIDGTKERDIKAALETLMASGQVLRNKKNRYAKAAHYGCILGTFLATERSFAFVKPDGQNEDIFIAPGRDGGAWQGDRVLVHLVPSRNPKRKSEGEVVRVLERSPRDITGVVTYHGKTAVLRPTSGKYPEMVLPKNRLGGAASGDRVAAKVMLYGNEKLRPQAAVTAVLGQEGTMEASIASILHENGIFEPFPREALAQADGYGETVASDALENRLDLRDKMIFTIDGDDAKDFDDAVSLEPLENGHLLLGVHIADVSNYVTPSSPLDAEAYRRGTSVYYPGHVVPMLPFSLSHGLCSLNPNVDRLTFSALMEVDGNGHRYGAKFSKSVICSKARMTYKKVNRILEGDAALREEYAPFVDTFVQMNALAGALRLNRMRRGALELDIPESEIVVDEKGEPVEVAERARGASEHLIEEFMLMANEAVAEYMAKKSAPTVYRVHENPDPMKLRAFALFARPFGYKVDPAKPEDTAQLQRVIDGAKNDPKQRILPTLLLRSLARARYADQCIGHYGLAAKYYLHFTSPIRRYPDLVAHRMLEKQLLGQTFGKADVEFCEEAATQSTGREYAADTAERDIDKLFLAAYMEQFLGQEFDGEVSGVQNFGIFVALPNSVEGLVRVEAMPGDYYEYDEQHMTMVGKRSGKRFTIGTPVRVRLAAASRVSGQIDFVMNGGER